MNGFVQRIQQSLEVAQTPREPSVTPRGGSTRVRKVPRNPWLDRETSHERLVRESSGISNRDQTMSGFAPKRHFLQLPARFLTVLQRIRLIVVCC